MENRIPVTNYIKKLVFYILWKFFALLYGICVLADWITYKVRPTQERRTCYIVHRSKWLRQLLG